MYIFIPYVIFVLLPVCVVFCLMINQKIIEENNIANHNNIIVIIHYICINSKPLILILHI